MIVASSIFSVSNVAGLLLAAFSVSIALAAPTQVPAAASMPAPQHEPVTVSVLPSQWQKFADISIEPAHAVYLGGIKELSHDAKDSSSHKAHFIAWAKLVYAKPQKQGAKSFTTEIVGVHIDCAKHTYSQFRDVKLDADDKTVDDSSKPAKFQPIPVNTPNIGMLSAAPSTAVAALSWSCGVDNE
jgi:hypothetical protein